MANWKFYLETRRPGKDGTCMLKIAITHKNRQSYVSLPSIRLLPNQWDNRNGVLKSGRNENLAIKAYIAKCQQLMDRLILQYADDGILGSVTASDIKEAAELRLDPEKAEKKQKEENRKKSFAYRYEVFMNTKTGGTYKIYERTFSKIVEYCESEKYNLKPINDLMFEDISKDWLNGFDVFLSPTHKKNTRNILHRCVRAVFNDAIDNEITTYYPFRRFKLINEPTRKRSLSVEDLRTLFNYPVEEYAQKHLDMFKLMFMLIGINPVDLCHLKEITNGRVEYNRAKTHKLYSIKVEPEALEIINKYRGKNWLIDALDRYTDYHDLANHMNKALKRIGPMERKGLGGKKIFHPLFPDISAYWARHTWATIAADLDIPMETISHALGHSFGCETTAIYINFNNKKIDEANRKVLDWVLYGIR